MKTFRISTAIVLMTFVGCQSTEIQKLQNSDAPATKTAEKGGPELMQDKSAMAGYGAESYRKVYEKDEIVTVLKNGMTVIAKRVSSPVVSVRCYVGTGGVYEGQWLGGGLSHLLEHLVAGGSNGRRTEAENRNLLQEIGNNSNAYTTTDHTAYFVNTTSEHLDKAVDLVAGWVLTAKITPDEYRREYQVVQRELEMNKGNPDFVFYEITERNRYLVSPARVPVIGYQEVIQGLSRDDVYNYYKKAYQPNNMIFSVAGDFDPEVLLKSVQKNVADAKPDREFSHDIPAEPAVLAPRTTVCTFPKIVQAKLQLAFPTIKLTDPDLYAADLLAAYLARGESSILVQEIRDKEIATGISAGDDTPTYVEGTFSITLEVPADKLQKATAAVFEQIEKVKKDGVDEDRLKRAKTQILTQRAFSQQTTEDIASSLAVDYLQTGDPHFNDRYVERIGKVTAKEVQAAAMKYLDASRLITTAMLPDDGKGSLPKAADLLRVVSPTTAPADKAGDSKIVRVELKNNTVLLLKRLKSSPLVNIQMYSMGGLSLENAKDNGIGNIAMSMLDRGTKTRSAEDIATFFDSIGGEFGASSGNNSWSWSAACLNGDFEKTIEVFADLVNNAAFPEKELAMMKERTVAAIQGQDAEWSQESMRFFKKSYFGPMNSPYQFMPIGIEENVKNFTQAQVNDYYYKNIIKGQRVLAIFGDIDVDKAQQLAATHLGGGAELPKIASMKPVPFSPANPDASKPFVNVLRVEVQKTKNPHTGIMIGYKSDSIVGDMANYPTALADTMVSGYTYPTGYLFEVLRGKGLTYDTNAFSMPGKDSKYPGVFLVYAGCEPNVTNEVVDLMLENIARLQGTLEDLQPQWFERSKKLITTAEAMNTETAAQQASTAAVDELFGLGYAYHDQFADKINVVKLPDVQAIARMRLRECIVTINTSDPDAVKIKPGKKTYDSFPPVDLTPRGVQHDTGGK